MRSLWRRRASASDPSSSALSHKDRRAHIDSLRGRLHRVAPDRLAKWLQQELASPAQQPADDNTLGIDEVAQAGHGHANLATRIRDGPPAAHVTI
jgi:hypothetical protein